MNEKWKVKIVNDRWKVEQKAEEWSLVVCGYV